MSVFSCTLFRRARKNKLTNQKRRDEEKRPFKEARRKDCCHVVSFGVDFYAQDRVAGDVSGGVDSLVTLLPILVRLKPIPEKQGFRNLLRSLL